MLKLKYADSDTDAAWLAAPGISIGSDRACNLVIAEPQVEGFHADITIGPEGAFVSDVGTDAGTYVNGHRLEGAVALHPGDAITIGRVELTVVDPHQATSSDITDLGAAAPPPAARTFGRWQLVCLNGPLQGRYLPLGETTVIGRATDCDLCIPHERMSRQHARLAVVGDRLSVNDLNSTHGTFHNGQRTERALLAPGDTITLDTLEFRVAGPHETAEPTADERDMATATIVTGGAAPAVEHAPLGHSSTTAPPPPARAWALTAALLLVCVVAAGLVLM